ncbi:hypothetical protein [Streptomyces sp. NBC_01276]|uniref:hypothetical protein n=1 Tax=Streptomyces sp. NBC_01276 TaxID=2903808 RepID=UPI00352F9D3D
MTAQIIEVISTITSACGVVCSAWHCFRTAKYGKRLELGDPPHPGAADSEAARQETGSVTVGRMLDDLPSGAVAVYEPPGGGRVIVWWMVPPAEGRMEETGHC